MQCYAIKYTKSTKTDDDAVWLALTHRPRKKQQQKQNKKHSPNSKRKQKLVPLQNTFYLKLGFWAL